MTRFIHYSIMLFAPLKEISKVYANSNLSDGSISLLYQWQFHESVVRLFASITPALILLLRRYFAVFHWTFIVTVTTETFCLKDRPNMSFSSVVYSWEILGMFREVFSKCCKHWTTIFLSSVIGLSFPMFWSSAFNCT